MQGKLFVVGTPIGNLGDMTPRAVETLKQADFIAAEDTRVTMKLLNYFGISTPMISAHEHNEQRRGQQIADRISKGESCALVTDAGMPCISDPGELIVQAAIEAGVEVVSVPGPSAAMAALSIAGISCARFCFEGFLSTAKAARRAHLKELVGEERTLVFYEAPHKLKNTLADMLAAWGDRDLALCREITKLHEEALRMTLSEAVEYYNQNAPRGEYVLVISGAKPAELPAASEEDAVARARLLKKEGMPPSEAAKRAAAQTGIPRSVIYKAIVTQEN